MTINDDDYRKAFEDKIIPALNDFKPGLIFISAGFDAHMYDPLAGINLSTEFFGEMTVFLKRVAEKHCDGRIISVLEGGYNLDILKETIKVHLTELAR
jgi:acetoin utilization deacetylase AcuC-like enzyme